MKKILLACSVLAASFSASAQLATGSIAPDFTFTDLSGTSHHLYDYLDSGKTVFIDVSAAWCGPCWNFHNSHALKDLYENHGPTGFPDVVGNTTNDVMVLFVEGELTNTGAQITGTTTAQTYAGFSQGDWTAGTTYPIIDLPNNTQGQTFLSGYAIGYFPTIYKVCPNRVIEEVGPQTAANLYASVDQCPAPASQPADVAALMYTGASYHCSGNYTPKVKIQNNGTQPLTNATITITVGGNTVSTGTFTGNLATYDLAEVTCTPISNYTPGTLTITVTTTDDAEVSNNDLSATVADVVQTTNVLLLDLKTDFWSEETAWVIKDANNANVAGTSNPTLANDTQYNLTYTLPSLGCYTFNITDSYGDGILNGNTNAGVATGMINLRDNANVTIMNNIDFGSGKVVPFKATVLEVDENAAVPNMVVYPNPASNSVNVTFEGKGGDYTVSVMDISGRVVAEKELTNANGFQKTQIEVSQLEAGNYFVVVKSAEASSMQKVVIK